MYPSKGTSGAALRSDWERQALSTAGALQSMKIMDFRISEIPELNLHEHRILPNHVIIMLRAMAISQA